MRASFASPAAALVAAPALGRNGSEAGAAARAEAGREPIDVEIRRAAPLPGDFERDGKLLVGELASDGGRGRHGFVGPLLRNGGAATTARE